MSARIRKVSEKYPKKFKFPTEVGILNVGFKHSYLNNYVTVTAKIAIEVVLEIPDKTHFE